MKFEKLILNSIIVVENIRRQNYFLQKNVSRVTVPKLVSKTISLET